MLETSLDVSHFFPLQIHQEMLPDEFRQRIRQALTNMTGRFLIFKMELFKEEKLVKNEDRNVFSFGALPIREFAYAVKKLREFIMNTHVDHNWKKVPVGKMEEYLKQQQSLTIYASRFYTLQSNQKKIVFLELNRGEGHTCKLLLYTLDSEHRDFLDWLDKNWETLTYP